MFRDWLDILPGQVDIIGVRYPGRETLLREPPLNNLQELVASLRQALQPLLDRPFAFFGHSMGAWIAFELAHELRRSGHPEPRVMFVSARRAPDVADRHPSIADLDDGAIIAEVQRRYGGIPEEILAEQELLRLLLPTLRADLQLLEHYEFAKDQTLSCEISALGGSSDRQVSSDDLQAWRRHTSGPFSQRLFDGSHFYLQQGQGPKLREHIAQSISRNFALGREL